MTEPRDDQQAPKPRLQALNDRRKSVRLTPGERMHSRRIDRLRWMLPVTALIIVAALMIWPKIELELSERRFSAPPIDKEAVAQAATENRLISANFSSIDSKGRPFSIVSTEAVQENSNPDTILLQNPKGTLKLDEETTMTAESKNGIFAQGAQHLTLNDDVVITRSDGTVMNTQTLFVNLSTSDAHTETPITVDGPDGKLTAQGMDMKRGGAVTIFPGPAKLILNSKTSIDPAKAGGGT